MSWRQKKSSWALEQALADIAGARERRVAMGKVGVAIAGIGVILSLLEITPAYWTLIAVWASMAMIWALGRAFSGGLSEESLDPARTRELEVQSIAWPLSALALVLPLTVHLLVFVGANGTRHLQREFDPWMALSAVLTTHAHLVIVYRAWAFAKRTQSEALPRSAGWSHGVSAVGAAALASIVPGLILIFIPTMIVLLTGMLVIPAAFALVFSRASAERRQLESIAAYDEMMDEQHEALLDQAADPNNEVWDRLLALRHLSIVSSSSRAGPTLDSCLDCPSARIRRAALDACIQLKHRPPIQAILKAASVARDDEALLTAQLLGFYRDRRAEPILIDLLRRSDAAVRIEAAKGLGRVGSRDAMLPLLEARRQAMSSAVRHAIKDAIGRIELKNGPEKRGALALLEPDTSARGGLSEADDEVGALALSDGREPLRASLEKAAV